ncbi:hypothetical protein ERJ75_000112900 [Trypanosoma vivax]|nr:hypothetical protein ERJ75_001065500 [Trypanosoma vivax]KAH8619973.1 hypothetical protein ERJ75_000112900 [Trypanosoma vivax]
MSCPFTVVVGTGTLSHEGGLLGGLSKLSALVNHVHAGSSDRHQIIRIGGDERGGTMKNLFNATLESNEFKGSRQRRVNAIAWGFITVVVTAFAPFVNLCSV